MSDTKGADALTNDTTGFEEIAAKIRLGEAWTIPASNSRLGEAICERLEVLVDEISGLRQDLLAAAENSVAQTQAITEMAAAILDGIKAKRK